MFVFSFNFNPQMFEGWVDVGDIFAHFVFDVIFDVYADTTTTPVVSGMVVKFVTLNFNIIKLERVVFQPGFGDSYRIEFVFINKEHKFIVRGYHGLCIDVSDAKQMSIYIEFFELQILELFLLDLLINKRKISYAAEW